MLTLEILVFVKLRAVIMQIRPRSALLHHQASLPPVSTSLLRPGSSQSTRKRAGQSGGRTSLTRSKSALGYRKKFRGPGAVSVEATTHGGGGRSLEANLSSALNMSATGSSSNISSSSNNSRGTKNALAQSDPYPACRPMNVLYCPS